MERETRETAPSRNMTGSLQQCKEELRDAYLNFKDLNQRCTIDLKSSSKLDDPSLIDHTVFYFKPETFLLDEPEKQRIYRENLIKKITTVPKPEPVSHLGDELHRSMCQSIADRSSPKQTKTMLKEYFKQKQYTLQHMKYKLLCRWAHHALTSGQLEKISSQATFVFGKLEKNLENTIDRLDRLSQEDDFDTTTPENKPSTRAETDANALYVEKFDNPAQSLIREDDIEVYIRGVTYANKTTRAVNKLMSRLKWFPMLKKYEIFEKSIEGYFAIKNSNVQRQKEISESVQKNFEKANVMTNELKEELKLILDNYYSKQYEGMFLNFIEKLEFGWKSIHDEVPRIITDQQMLKYQIQHSAQLYNFKGDIEIDNGNSFSYQVTVFFPTYFQTQVLKSSFTIYDAFCEDQEVSVNQNTKIGQIAKIDMNIFSDLSSTRQNIPTEEALQADFRSTNLKIIRLKSASDWIDYVALTPSEDDWYMKQQTLLTNNNSIDTLLQTSLSYIDVNDFATVSRVLEDYAYQHQQSASKLLKQNPHESLAKVQVQTAEGACQLTVDLTSIRNSQDPATNIQEHLLKAVQPSQIDKESTQSSKQEQETNKTQLRYLPQHLIISLNTLRFMSSRDSKIKLLYIMNYFRATQKRLAIDLREFATRDRIEGHLVNPQVPAKESNQLIISTSLQATKQFDRQKHISTQEVLSISKKMTVFDKTAIEKIKDMATMRGYKAHGFFNTKVFNTCPYLPPIHSSNGESLSRQSLDEQMDRESQGRGLSEQAISLMGRIDLIELSEQTKEVFVKDDFGIYILYDCALQDMKTLEEELCKIGSYYLNKSEMLLDPLEQQTRPNAYRDRLQIIDDLLQKELDFQFQKVKLIQVYVECYEHISNPLEQQKIMQVITDLMSRRPRLNLGANYFIDSFDAEILCIQKQFELVKRLVDVQISIEKTENKRLQDSLNLSYTLANEYAKNKWKYQDAESLLQAIENRRKFKLDEERKLNKLRGNESHSPQPDDPKRPQQSYHENNKQQSAKKSIAGEENSIKGSQHKTDETFDDGLESIDSADEADYLKPNKEQFSNLLGLPQITIETIYQSYRDKDTDIIKLMKEHVNFVTVHEGYPEFLTMLTHKSILSKNKLFKPNQWSQNTGALDFYCSLDFVTKFYSVVQSIQNELYEGLKMWDPSLMSHIDAQVADFCQQEFKYICQVLEGAEIEYQGRELVEDEQILGNSEKIIFLAKEMLSDLTLQPKHMLDPFIVAKLDVQTINFFNFPNTSLQMNKYTMRKNGIVGAQYLEMMEKEYITRLAKERVKTKIPAALSQQISSYNQRNVQTPSQLETYCNIVELLRLRSELIMATSETTILQQIYLHQSELLGIKDQKVQLQEGINFDTLGTDYLQPDVVNYMDHGTSYHDIINLAVAEFDPTLLSNMNFRNPDTLKLNILSSGLEEFRAILAYQIFQKQILIVATRINSLLIDSHQRALSELNLMSNHKIVIPNSIINYNSIYNRNFDTINWQGIKKQVSFYKQSLNYNCAPIYYNIISKKTQSRTSISKDFSAYKLKVMNTYPYQTYCVLRVLRAFKIKLLSKLISNIQTEVYMDASKVQALLSCQKLRHLSRYFDFDPSKIGIPGDKPTILQCETSKFLDNYPLNYQPSTFIQIVEKINNQNQEVEYRVLNPSSYTILDASGIPSSISLLLADSAPLEDIRIIKEKQRQIFLKKLGVKELQEIKEIDPLINNPEIQIKELLPTYTVFEQFENLSQKGQTISLESLNSQLNYKEALNFGETKYAQLTMFYAVIDRVIQLELFLMRLEFEPQDIIKVEHAFWCGLPLWKNDDFDNRLKSGLKILASKGGPNKRSEHYLKSKIIQHRTKKDIASALINLSLLLKSFTDQYNKTKLEKKTEYLHQYVEFRFQQIVGSLYKICTQFMQQNNTIAVDAVQKSITKLIQMEHVKFKQLRPNNYTVSMNMVSPTLINLEPGNLIQDSLQWDEVQNFNRCVQPIINEKSLEPPQLTLFQTLYQRDPIRCCGTSQYAGQIFGTQNSYPFRSLETALLSLKLSDRQYCQGFINLSKYQANDFMETVFGESMTKVTNEVAYSLNQLSDAKKFCNEGTQALLLQNALICWYENSSLPSDKETFEKYHDNFRQNFFWKQLEQKEEIIKASQMGSQLNGQIPTEFEVNAIKQKIANLINNQSLATQNEESQRDALVAALREEFTTLKKKVTLDNYYATKAEIQVYKNELEKFLIKASVQALDDESAALSRCFTLQVPSIQYHIHPFQQFAATLFDTVDPNMNLDVCNKVAAIQALLTKFRNRGTEVETLTSGPGMVITIKDFNEIMNDFCRMVIKDQEKQFKSRNEQWKFKEEHYMNSIYIKDQKIKAMESRIQNANLNIENIIAARLFEKGNQLIYELDSSNRVLQLFKNAIYNLEPQLEQKILGEQLQKFKRKNNQVEMKDQKFNDYKEAIISQIEADFADDQHKIKLLLKDRAEQAKITDSQSQTQVKSTMYPISLFNKNSGQNNGNFSSKQTSENGHIHGAVVPKNFQHYTHCVCYKPDAKYPRPTLELAELEMLSERDARNELQRMCILVRKQRLLYRTKEMCLMTKYQEKINLMSKQQTNNSFLWDQLAESQKREGILKTELVQTQQSLIETEKAVDLMREKIKNLDADNRRLQKFKLSKVERLKELEAKVKKVEVFDVIDSDRLVNALTKRDEQLTSLRNSEQHFEARLKKLQSQSLEDRKQLKGKLTEEQKKTQTAIEKMEQLKLELKMLEQNDSSVASIWKKKCLDLFEVCQSMKQENDELRERCKDLIDQGIALTGQLNFVKPLQHQNRDSSLPELKQSQSAKKLTLLSPNSQGVTSGQNGYASQLSKLQASLLSANTRTPLRNSLGNMKTDINTNQRADSYEQIQTSKLWSMKSPDLATKNPSGVFSVSHQRKNRNKFKEQASSSSSLIDSNLVSREINHKSVRIDGQQLGELLQNSQRNKQNLKIQQQAQMTANWPSSVPHSRISQEQPAIDKLKNASRFQRSEKQKGKQFNLNIETRPHYSRNSTQIDGQHQLDENRVVYIETNLMEKTNKNNDAFNTSVYSVKQGLQVSNQTSMVENSYDQDQLRPVI